jgi:hypothetical protein
MGENVSIKIKKPPLQSSFELNWSGLKERKQSGELFSDDRRMFVRLQTSESDVPQALQTECPQRVSE